MPLISVIIPTCHRNDLLTKCLDCLAPGIQTLPPDQYEVIVTDDGSLSTAEHLVRENYHWAQWVSGPRKGPAANRNSGAKLAKGEWLAFTDDDCLPSPVWLEGFHTAIQNDLLVYEGKTTCEAGLHSPMEHAPINLTGGWLWSCNMMVHKDIYSKIGGFDEGFPHPHMEDTDFRERLKNERIIFLFVPDAIVDHPPRKISWGKRMGATHESGVLFWYKQGHSKRIRKKLVIDIIRSRTLGILRSRFSFDTLSAFVSFGVELIYVCTKIDSWERKYRSRYIKTP